MTHRARYLACLALVAGVGGCASWPLPWTKTRPAWELPPPATRDAPVVAAGRLHRSTLDNDLRVLILEDPRLPRVALGVTLRRSAASVPPGQAGLASFTAELMERGAGDRDALALALAVDELGASLSVAAGWDSLSVEISGLSRDFDALLRLLADVVLRPRFERPEAGRARAEQLAGLERAKDDPGTLARWHFQRALYPGHRFGVPLAGVPESVALLDAQAAREFHRRIAVPGNAVVYVVGDVEAVAIRDDITQAFAGFVPGPIPEPGTAPAAVTPMARRVVVVNRPELGQAQIAMGHEGISRTDPTRLAVQLMNLVVGGGGFSSRLMTSVRAEEGLTYGVYSRFSTGRTPGPFSISTFTRVPEVGRAVKILLEELERARREPPGTEELRDARSYAVGRFSLTLESSPAVMSSLVDLDVYGLPEDSLDTYRARIRAVTEEQVALEARRRLHPDRLVISVVGPAEALVLQLEAFGPVTVVEP